MNRAFLIAAAASAFAVVLAVWSLADGFTLAFVFPGLAALAMVAMGAVMVVQTLFGAVPEKAAREQGDAIQPGLGVAALIAFAWLVPHLGFYVTAAFAFVLVSLCAGWPDRRQWIVVPAVALVFIAVVWLVFARVLAVKAPAGLLF